MKISSNNISLAGEFAVLSQLALRGYDANMTLGRTKGVDILVSDPTSKNMFRLEVKTSFRKSGGTSKLFGKFACSWIMGEKHEEMIDESLFYCFVNISDDTKQFRFFIIPSVVVASYVKTQHDIWLADADRKTSTSMRQFRIGTKSEQYPIPTPTIEEYEDNWEFKAKNLKNKKRKTIT